MHLNSLFKKSLIVIFVFFATVFVANIVFSDEKLSKIIIEDVNVQNPPYSATITILEHRGEPTREIPKDQLKAYIDGQEMPEKDFSLNLGITESSEGSSILVWDISKSITKISWEDGQRIVLSILDKLDAKFNLSLISVGDKVGDITGFTNDRTLLRNKLSSLSPIANRTLLNESIYYAVEQMESYSGEKRVILLFTDGIDEGSYLTEEDCIERVKQKGIRVVVFDLGEELGRGSNFLKRLARVSNGSYLHVNQKVDIARIVETIVSPSRVSYVVSFDHPRLGKPGPHEIKIAIKDSNIGIIKDEVSKHFFIPFTKSNWKDRLIVVVITLLFLSGAVVLILYSKYLRNKREKVAPLPVELGELRKGVEKLQKETDNFGKQVWNYGGIREERIHRWREACFATAGKAVSVLKTCWLERDNPVGKAIYDELVLSLKTIGLEVIKP